MWYHETNFFAARQDLHCQGAGGTNLPILGTLTVIVLEILIPTGFRTVTVAHKVSSRIKLLLPRKKPAFF